MQSIKKAVNGEILSASTAVPAETLPRPSRLRAFFARRDAVHPTVRLDYPVRISAIALSSFVMISSIWGRGRPLYLWILILAVMTLWPHIAYFIASRSANSKAAELRNLLFDSFIIGGYSAFSQFELWPTVGFIMSINTANLSIGGPKFAARGLLATAAGAVLAGTLTHYAFRPESTPLTTALIAVSIFVYTSVFGFHSYVQTKRTLRARRETAEARRLAEEASQAKSAFLANMSHELRTPLNAIIGYSEMLEEEAAETNAHLVADVKKIQTAGRHLLDLINNVLDVSKIEAGKMSLFVESADLDKVVDDVVVTARQLVEKNGNVFEVRATALGSARCDVTKLRQIMLNLLSNAARFTNQGRVILEIARGDGRLQIDVVDTGIGMTPEQQKRLFQPFAQADAAITRKYGGTGLGLALSRRFAQMMGGDITLQSDLGAGTRFIVSIPIEGAS